MTVKGPYGKYDTTETQQSDVFFDVAAADQERLAARIGQEPWTERAAGRDEALNREVSNKIKQQLGNQVSESMKPE